MDHAQSRRQHARIRVGEQEVSAVVRLGVHRMLVETHERLPIGTPVEVRLRGPRPFDGELAVRTTVCWNAADGIAVQCEGMRARDVWSIHRLMTP